MGLQYIHFLTLDKKQNFNKIFPACSKVLREKSGEQCCKVKQNMLIYNFCY